MEVSPPRCLASWPANAGYNADNCKLTQENWALSQTMENGRQCPLKLVSMCGLCNS